MTMTGERGNQECVDVCECREEVFEQMRMHACVCVCVYVNECLCMFVSALCVCVWSQYTHFQQVSSFKHPTNNREREREGERERERGAGFIAGTVP